MWRTADATVNDVVSAMPPDGRQLYAKHIAGLRKAIPTSQKIAVPPQKVAAVVEKALTARSPRARYVVGLGPKMQLALLSGLHTGLRDRVLRTAAKQPG